MTEEERAKQKADWQRAYRKTPEGKAARRKEILSEGAKRSQKKYKRSEKGLKAQLRWAQKALDNFYKKQAEEQETKG